MYEILISIKGALLFFIRKKSKHSIIFPFIMLSWGLFDLCIPDFSSAYEACHYLQDQFLEKWEPAQNLIKEKHKTFYVGYSA